MALCIMDFFYVEFRQKLFQFDLLNEIINEKLWKLANRKCIVFHQDNTRPHLTPEQQKLVQLSKDALLHPLYSHGLAAPSDLRTFVSIPTKFI